MSLRKREKIQEVSRYGSVGKPLVLAVFAAANILAQSILGQPSLTQPSLTQSSDAALWREFGLVEQTNAKLGKANATMYRMKDVTGAVAVWEWQRGDGYQTCNLEPFCSTDGQRTVVASANYVVSIVGAVRKPNLDAFLLALPKRKDSSLPPILTYVPRRNLIPNSARYVLGDASLEAFAPQLRALKLGFDQGGEAQIAEYKSDNAQPTHLAIFYYPTPEMARLHTSDLRRVPGLQVKRSSFLVAVVFGGGTDQQANALLNQIQYEAKITWNDIPPPSPIKPLYQLLRNIIFLSGVLVALCFVSGLVYAGIRLYRRRFGTLEEDEAMTSLNLSGD